MGGGANHIDEIDVGDSASHVDAHPAANTEGIEYHLVAANKRVGAGADARHNRRRRPNIIAGERARTERQSRRQYRPNDHAGGLKADVDPDPVDRSFVEFGGTVGWREDAIKPPARADKKLTPPSTSHFN
jgi:hypothetical protein